MIPAHLDKNDRDFIKQIRYAINALDHHGTPKIFPFLNMHEQKMLLQIMPKYDVQVSLDGGYFDATYKRAQLYLEDLSSFDIVVLTLLHEAQEPLKHRMILGAFTSLGLQRNDIGDIIPAIKPIAFVTRAAASLIQEQCKKIGNEVVDWIEISNPTIEHQHEAEKTTIFIKTWRLDGILARALNLSRENGKLLAISGRISVNHQLIENASYLLSSHDIISIRGLGRIHIHDQAGNTKSGRIALEITILR